MREQKNVIVWKERLIDGVKKGYCFFVIIYCGFCRPGEYWTFIGRISFGGFLIL